MSDTHANGQGPKPGVGFALSACLPCAMLLALFRAQHGDALDLAGVELLQGDGDAVHPILAAAPNAHFGGRNSTAACAKDRPRASAPESSGDEPGDRRDVRRREAVAER